MKLIKVGDKGYLTSIQTNLKEINSIEKAIQSDLPSLVTLKKEYNEEFVLDMIQLRLYGLNDLFGSNMQMSERQIQLLAEKILKDYFFFRLSDLKVLFDRLEVTKFFGQLSPNLILLEIEKYFNERSEIASSVSVTESDYNKDNYEAPSLILKHLDKIKDMPKIKEAKPSRKSERQKHREAQLRYLKEKARNEQ